jgi:copper transport protein
VLCPEFCTSEELLMVWLRRAVRCGIVPAVLAAVFALGFASPASAHAELVTSTPANGTRLEVPPADVELRFTESVNLIDGGMRLVGAGGATVPTAFPVSAGRAITWPMPKDLRSGSYVVSWRVISSDGHPISGAFSFGVGAAAHVIPDAATGSTTGSATPAAPWPVLAARLAGYMAFAAFAGVIAFVLWCAPGPSTTPALQKLARLGLTGGILAALLGLLLQGPYTAGMPMSHVLRPVMLRETVATPFGLAMLWRLALYTLLIALAWRLPTVRNRPQRWLVPAGVTATAGAIAAAGHGAASGRLTDLAVVAAHVLAAGIWVGGLLVLTAIGRSVDRSALAQFSRLAMIAVLALVVTGVLNSLHHVNAVDQLFLSRYGLLLLAKLTLVAAALAGAAVSRRRLKQQRIPLLSVRSEAVLTAAVLLVTAVLSMTPPPPNEAVAASNPAASRRGPSARNNEQVQMPLGEGRTAVLEVLPANTAGSRLHLLVTDDSGTTVKLTRVDLKVSNPDRHLAAIPVPMVERYGQWAARYRFPFSGTWKAILTVQDRDLNAVVTAGTVNVVDRAGQ